MSAGGGNGGGGLPRPPSINASNFARVQEAAAMAAAATVSQPSWEIGDHHKVAGSRQEDVDVLDAAVAVAAEAIPTIPTAEALLEKSEQLVAEQRENIKNEIENVITPGTVSAAKTLFRNMARKAVKKERLSQAAKNIVQTAAQSTVPNLLNDINQAAMDADRGDEGDGNGGGDDGSS
jgi:histone H3/H4